MTQVRQDASSYASRILEQAKQFEYKMQRICDHYHLPRSVLALHVYYLWELISCDMLEQFSRIAELTDCGRKTMYNDVSAIIDHILSNSALSKDDSMSIRIHLKQRGIAEGGADQTMSQRSEMADASAGLGFRPVVPQGLVVLKEYVLAYFYDLP